VLQCSAPKETAEAWNAARPEGEAYSEAVFKDLWGRYEEPDPRNRWDKPLFRLNAQQQQEAAAILQVKLQRDIASHPTSMQAWQNDSQSHLNMTLSLKLITRKIYSTGKYAQVEALGGSLQIMYTCARAAQGIRTH